MPFMYYFTDPTITPRQAEQMMAHQVTGDKGALRS